MTSSAAHFVPWRTRNRRIWSRSRGVKDRASAVSLGCWMLATGNALPKALLFHGYSPGDDLMCTAVLRELSKRGREPSLIISNHPQLFAGNPDAAFVRPGGQRFYIDGSPVSIYKQFARIWGGRFSRLMYAPYDGDDQSEPPTRHIIADLCASAGITGQVAIRPYLTLSEDERTAAAWAADKIVVQSGGLAALAPMRNKEWVPGRFQSVVDALAGEFDFIQIGSRSDQPLRGVNDQRGLTSFRESAAILSQARMFVGTVGFPMHLARAAECPSVIVYGGREAPWQSGYVCNINLSRSPPCAPCWRWNRCDFDRQCMRDIGVDDVVSAIREMLARPRGPLATETVGI